VLIVDYSLLSLAYCQLLIAHCSLLIPVASPKKLIMICHPVIFPRLLTIFALLKMIHEDVGTYEYQVA
jgi:hypothetical protein